MTRTKKKKKTPEEKAAAKEMAKAEVPMPETEATTPQVENIMDRDVSMFKGWLLGKTFNQLAEQYGISFASVAAVSLKWNWKGLKKELRLRQYAAAVDRMRDFTVFVQDALEADIRALVKKAVDNNQSLSKDERDHLYKMYDRTLKEIRLDDGKPTEIGNAGTVQVEIVLPAGAKRFGILPPDPKVTLTETSKEKKPTIDLDAIEAEKEGKSND